jgi:hypothetical protein
VAPEGLRVERWHLGSKAAFNSRGFSEQKPRQRRREQSRDRAIQVRDSNNLTAAGGGGSQVAVAGLHPEAQCCLRATLSLGHCRSAARPRTAIRKGLFSWALRGELRWIWRLRLWASGTVLLRYTPRLRMRSFSASVDSVPEVRPRGDLRQDGQVRDGLLSVTGPPNPSRVGFLCAPPRSLLSSPSDVVRYLIHFLGRGNESGV